MNSDTLLDFALFQLSPRRSRCELFVSGNGKTEKLASGLLKPFVTHLKAAEEQAAQAAVQSIKLEVEKRKHAGTWFNKGTLERFVRFVSTPEVLEVVSTLDAEMSQLEGARRIYSQGIGDRHSSASGGSEIAEAASADVTKKELLRAIDVRLVAARQDLTMACSRTSAAGFTLESVSELRLFADYFGAHRLNDACSKFLSLCQRRPELITRPPEHHQQQPSPPAAWNGPPLGLDDRNVRGSSGSDMSIDDPEEPTPPAVAASSATRPVSSLWPSSNTGSNSSSSTNVGQVGSSQQPQPQPQPQRPFRARSAEPPAHQEQRAPALTKSSSSQKIGDEEEQSTSAAQPPPSGGARRLSVQDRINLFENKQKEQSGGVVVGGKAGGKAELRRLSSDVSSSVERSVLRRWSGASDMSIDLPISSSSGGGNNRKEAESAATTPSSFATSKAQASSGNEERDTASSSQPRSGLDNLQSTTSFSSSQFSSLAKGRDCTEEDRIKHQVASSGQQPSSLEKEKADSKVLSGSSLRFPDELGGRSAAQNNLKSSSAAAEKELRDRAESHTQRKSFAGIAEQPGSIARAAPWTQTRALSGASEEETSQKEQSSSVFSNRVIHVKLKELGTSENPQMTSARPVLGQSEGACVDQSVSLTQYKPFENKSEDMGLHKKGKVGSHIQQKSPIDKAETSVPKNETSAPQSHGKTLAGKSEEIRKSESVAQAQPRVFSTRMKEEEDSDLRGMKLHRQNSAPGQKRFHDRIDERAPTQDIHPHSQRNAPSEFTGKMCGESRDAFDPVPSSVEQVQMVRPSKGNQELNDELQMKADELEKLFAAHKLRLQGDQASASRRGRPVDLTVDSATNVTERRLGDAPPERLPERRLTRDPASNGTEFDADILVKVADNQDYANTSRQKLGDLSSLEDPRGKFYESYMQKRDAKLREEWDSNRAQKEAEMKKMHDDLERSRAEMKAKFAGSADKQDSALHARRRAEKLRSFGLSLAMKKKAEQLESSQSEDEEDQESSEYTQYGHDSSFGDIAAGENSSRSNNSRKLLPSRSVSSSTPRTSTVSIPRSSLRGVNSGSGRRRPQPENPLAQSVPNFSDLRKENTKPSGSSKLSTRSQPRNFARSKSTSEEEKPRRSQSLRKGSPGPGELKDLSSGNTDSVILMPLKSSKDQSDPGVFNKSYKSGESKPFLRKGSGIGPGAGAGIAKSKISLASENLKGGEEPELGDELKDPSYIVKEEDEEEFERISTEEAAMAVDFPAGSDNERQSLSQGSGDSGEAGSENGEVTRLLSQVDDESAAALAAISSKFNTSVGAVQESPGESPGSWNSHMNHSFSYAHEASDIDASVDSPVGSPASWNSHSLNQMEADVIRMRRKWGNAQKPIMIANSSNQPRKDVTKGFKRLLKFGRKSKGAESLVTDWVSASTASEGDDDTEDGRDPANRSSDDLRKTRMGSSQYHYTHDGFNEGEAFHEQVQPLRTSIPAPPGDFKLRDDQVLGNSLKAPRSFFSLSSFRSKGSESKLR